MTLLLLLCNFQLKTQAQTMATNPIIWADVPDIAIVRVGETNKISSTIMYLNPSVPIMKSKDLMNWNIVNYCYYTQISIRFIQKPTPSFKIH